MSARQQTEKRRLHAQEQLLLSVVEQVKLPLTQIARLAELSGAGQLDESWQAVQMTADSALGLVESYALSLRLQGNSASLELEPVTVSSLLYDTAHDLQDYANRYHVDLELDTGPRMLPVMGDKRVLQSALTSLGYVFVEASAQPEGRAVIRLGAHKSRYGIVAGLYTSAQDLGAESLRNARALHGYARQPLQRLSTNPAAGVFVADSLLHALSSKLHVARYHKLTGLAATLAPSQQLQLVQEV